MINQQPTKTRHLTVLCEPEPRQNYVCRKVTPGCGQFYPHSTKKTASRKKTATSPEQPWFSVCPYCGKKARMDLRAVTEHESRHEAVREAHRRNFEREGGVGEEE